MLMKTPSLLCALSVICGSVLSASETPDSVAIQLGRTAVEEALNGQELPIIIDIDPGNWPKSQSYEVSAHEKMGKSVDIHAADEFGVMYGLFALADRITHEGIDRVLQSTSLYGTPHHDFRAIKFNLPWDAYRTNPAITQHYEICRDPAYWEAFLNMMARNRFNALTLWNLHPWPFLIRAENFPEACSFTDEELAEWQTLFRTIFRLAKERGIETYLVNWNIFVSPALAEHHGWSGRANITTARGFTAEQQEMALRYNRESVTQVLNEYPNLTGIGLSLGEAMGGVTAEFRQQWVLDAIVAGVQQADRPARLIHRVPFSAGLSNGGTTSRSTEELTRNALESIEGVETPIIIEAKFNWSHAHSSPKLIKVHGGSLSDAYANPAPENFRMAWMMRNEDFFFLRWGEPDFVREVIARNSDPASTNGYFIGSECYIPALDYFTKAENRPWDYAFERQWLFYEIWGRLLYDPTTPDSVFVQSFIDRYGPDVGPRLFNAWRLASRVPLRLTSFVDINNDKSFYAEGFLAREGIDSSEFLSLEMLMIKGTLDPAYESISDYVDRVVSNAGWDANLLTPVALADLVSHEANAAYFGIDPSWLRSSNEALCQEATDVMMWAQLGWYFSAKLKAGVDLALFQNTGDESLRASAREHMAEGVRIWNDLAQLGDRIYREVPLTHLHYYYEGDPMWARHGPKKEAKFRRDFKDHIFSWSRLLPFVEADLDFIDNAIPATAVEIPPENL